MNHSSLWTIDELGSQVALALSDNYDGQSNGSIRAVPDRRTIRYYTTRGLLDRPAEMRGRTALYSRRHLLQLVAIKRLQTRGQTLEQIQQRLLGLTDSGLEAIARIPKLTEEPKPAEPQPRSESFWKDPPTEIPSPPPIEPSKPSLVQGLPLSDEVTLLLEAIRTLEEDDIEAIRAVAAPLLTLLQRRRLIRPRPQGAPHDPNDDDSDGQGTDSNQHG